LPDGWTWTTIKNVAEINYGKGLPKRDRNDEGTVPVYGSSGITGYHSESIVEGPCLIIGRKGAAGAVHLSMTDCWPIDTTYYANLKSSISLKYAFYVLKTLELESLDRSTAIPSLSRDDLYVQSFPLAPIPEQERIVAEIEKQFTRLDQAVASLRRLQSNLARYKASVLKAACDGRLVPQNPADEPAGQLLERILAERRAQWQAANPGKKYKEPVGVEETAELPQFPDLPSGWIWATAEQLSRENRSITYGVVKLGEEVENGVPTLRSSNVRHLRLDTSFVKKISSKIADNYRRTYLEGGEILVTVRGTLGGVAVVPDECKGFNISREVAMIALVEPKIGPAIQYSISSQPIQNWLNRRTRGIAYTGINIATLKQTPIPLPPLAEQERIVAEVERRLSVVTAVEQTITANLSRAERLRQSILHRAFTGQLVPHEGVT
jgi:type I restriction enzyme S subunit